MPLNDGFGGWVYWGAVPRLGITRVEIAPGASSALFGSSAMGGVVEIVSRAIVDRAEVELQGGSFGTGEAALSLGKRGDTLAAPLDLEGLGTAGYQVIASPGLVDHDASSRRASGRARLERGLPPRSRLLSAWADSASRRTAAPVTPPPRRVRPKWWRA